MLITAFPFVRVTGVADRIITAAKTSGFRNVPYVIVTLNYSRSDFPPVDEFDSLLNNLEKNRIKYATPKHINATKKLHIEVEIARIHFSDENETKSDSIAIPRKSNPILKNNEGKVIIIENLIGGNFVCQSLLF